MVQFSIRLYCILYIVYEKNRKLKLKYSCYIEAEKGNNPHNISLYTKTMVRVIAELSVNTPTACSSDRYKYRFGYSGGGAHGHEQVIYKRPAPAPKSSMSQRKTEHQPLLDVCDNDDIVDIGDNGTNICSIYCMNNNISTISRKVSEIEDTINETNKMILMNRQLREKHEKREIDEKEKEKEKEKQPEINRKLGKIIYRSRTGDLFEAHHSVHMTVVFVFDKKTGDSTQTTTQKVVWNDKVFETKQYWFSEMAKVSAQRADDNMMVVRCE